MGLFICLAVVCVMFAAFEWIYRAVSIADEPDDDEYKMPLTPEEINRNLQQ